MNALVNTLVKFINMSAKGKESASGFSQAIAGVVRTVRDLTAGLAGLISMALGPLASGLMDVVGFFGQTMKNAIGFDLSIQGLLEQAEEARKFFSELADELNFYSSATGSTTNATNILMESTGKSLATHQALKQTFSSMVDAGADADDFIKDMLPTLGEFELKTGVAGTQFGLLSTKFQQMLSEKKGIGKDIKKLQKALIGTGLKGAQLETTMQGLTEAAEKLAFATRGATLDIKQLSDNYGATVATFKAFGVSAQTTTNFINGLMDPENMEKNMLLMNKMGVSYEQFNEMLNSGKGQDKFFDKILNNVGKVGREASLIQDASTRYKYLKDTLGLPPEIANKLMKVAPNKMQAELRKVKREMEEAEKKDKWRKQLKAKEEKYEEEMRFIRMQMVQPLVDLIQGNRQTMIDFMRAMKPVIQGLASMLKTFMIPIDTWFNNFSVDLGKLTSSFKNLSQEGKTEKITQLIQKHVPAFFEAVSEAFSKLWYSEEMQQIILPLGSAIGKMFKAAIKYAKAVILGDSITFQDAINQVEEDDKKSNKEKWAGDGPGVDKSKVDADMKKFNDQLDDIKQKSNEAGLATKQQKDEMNKNEKEIESQNKEIEKQMESYRKARSEGNDKDAIKIKKQLEVETEKYTQMLTEQRKLIGKANTSNFDENNPVFIKETERMRKSMNDYVDERTEMGRASGGNKSSITKAPDPGSPMSQKTQDSAALIIDNLDPGKVNEIAAKIMSNPDLKKYIGGIIIQNAAVKIDGLKEVLSVEKEKSDSLIKQIKELKIEMKNFENNTTVGILKKWEDKFFGKSGETMFNFLFNVNKNLFEANKNQKRIIEANKNISTDNKGFQSISGTGSSATGRNSNLVNKAAGTSVKSIQVKQTLFLKSIADSTYDTAIVLRYIGKNLNFTTSGLAVKDSTGNAITGAIMYDLNGLAYKPGGVTATNIFGMP